MPQDGKLADGFLPCRVIAGTGEEQEVHVGDFPKGVVLSGMTLNDVETQMPIAHLAKMPGTGTDLVPPRFVWEVPTQKRSFQYVFIQVMPSDAPLEINMPGVGKRVIF